MKKQCKALLLALALIFSALATLAVPTMAQDTTDPFYYSQFELEKTATSGMTVKEFDGASGGKITYGTGAGTSYRMDFKVNVPKAGDYSIWVRAYAKSTHQCSLFYTANSVLANKISVLTGSSVAGGAFVWFKLDARDAVAGPATHTGIIPLSAGDNRFQFQVRSVANVVDSVLVNDGATKTTHYFDCFLVTDNANFDPNYHWDAQNGVRFANYTGAQDRVNEADATKRDVRFVAALDDHTKYESVGFEFGYNGKVATETCKYVYTSLQEGDGRAYPTTYYGQYFYCFTIRGLAAGSYTFTVTPLVTPVGGSTVRGQTVTVTVTVDAAGTVSYS